MANLLTAIRLLLALPVAWAFADAQLLPPLLLAVLLALAIATDYFDGRVARASKADSVAGRLFDHGTDFVFVTGGLAGAALAGLIHPLLPALIVFAFAQYLLDSHFLYKQKQLRMSFLGRWNGILYFVPLVVIALSRLELLSHLAQLLRELAALTGYALIASTIASIVDRGVAPLRKASGGVGD